MLVQVRDNNVDQALKALKKKMQREGIFREMKLRNYYEKPSEKRVREQAEAVRRARKLARKRAQREGLLPGKAALDQAGRQAGWAPGSGPPRAVPAVLRGAADLVAVAALAVVVAALAAPVGRGSPAIAGEILGLAHAKSGAQVYFSYRGVELSFKLADPFPDGFQRGIAIDVDVAVARVGKGGDLLGFIWQAKQRAPHGHRDNPVAFAVQNQERHVHLPDIILRLVAVLQQVSHGQIRICPRAHLNDRRVGCVEDQAARRSSVARRTATPVPNDSP